MTPYDVDEIRDAIRHGLTELTESITPIGAARGTDAAGGKVGSLTEAMMGITGGLVKVAEAIESLAASVEQK